MLKVEDLYFDYFGKTIFEGISFSLKKGEIVALIGISGSGKTTLFKLISGLLDPKQGEIWLDGCSNNNERGQLTTFMRQEDLLLPWRTVLENLLLFTELGKQKKSIPTPEALNLLKKVGLEGCENLYPKALSGGMRQRVALARALIQNRPLMLLDEPFASLDVILREQLYALLREVRQHYQKTILMVTHDFRDAMALADRILVLSGGKIVSAYDVSASSFAEISSRIRADLLDGHPLPAIP